MNPRIIIKTAKTKVPKILLPPLKEITGLPTYSIEAALESTQDCMVECSKAELLEFIEKNFSISIKSANKFKEDKIRDMRAKLNKGYNLK